MNFLYFIGGLALGIVGTGFTWWATLYAQSLEEVHEEPKEPPPKVSRKAVFIDPHGQERLEKAQTLGDIL